MIPCLNKKLLGFECLGCGGQRALSLLFHGEFVAAFKIYPAIYTLILFALFIILNLFYKFKKYYFIHRLDYYFTQHKSSYQVSFCLVINLPFLDSVKT